MELGFGQVVPPAINFDHQTRAMMDEINNVASHRGLPSDVEVQAAKRFPEGSFASGHVAA